MNFASYLDIDAVNWSTLKEMRRSPRHYEHRRRVPREDKASLIFGRCAHTLILQPERFELDYAVFEGETRRGKAWDAFKEEHADKSIIKRSELEQCAAVRDAVLAHPIASQYLAGGRAEYAVDWVDPVTGLRCKGLIDYLHDDFYVDLKTTGDVDLRRFAALVARMGYHNQMAWYGDGAKALDARVRKALIIAVEKDAPHDVAVFDLSASELALGGAQNRGLLDRVAECTTAGVWPGRYTEKQPLALPSWAFNDEEDAPDFDDVETTEGADLQ